MNYNGQRSGAALIVIAMALVLIAGACLIGTLQLVDASESAHRQYQEAPFCDGRGVLANESLTCRLVAPMLVTVKDYYYTGNRHVHIHHSLNLRTATGSTYTANIGPHLWRTVSVGQLVRTERWQDDVVSVSAGGLTSSTTATPLGPGTGMALVWVCVVFLGLSVAMLVSGCIRAAREQ